MPKNRTAFGLVRVLKLTAILWLQKIPANWSGAAAFATVFWCSVSHNKQATYRAFNAIFGKVGRAASAEVMIQLFNSKCLSILYYGIDVCPLTSTQINSLQFVVNSCYKKFFMINSNDDIKYRQDVFGCLPVADIVKRRTTSFSNEYWAVNDNNIVCQACVLRWLPAHCCYWLVKFSLLFFTRRLSTTCGEIKMYTNHYNAYI